MTIHQLSRRMQLGELPRSPFNGRGILRSKSCADSPVPTANILSAFIPWGGSLCLKVPTSLCVDGKDPVTLSFDRIGILCMPRDGSRELKRVATYGPENHHFLESVKGTVVSMQLRVRAYNSTAASVFRDTLLAPHPPVPAADPEDPRLPERRPA